MRSSFLFLTTLLLCGCVGMPAQITPVQSFELPRYLGKWYEIARLDHSFERGLVQVTAEYSMRPDGGVRVLNRGYSTKDKEWSVAEGKAYFVREPQQGYLKVSFFGPFYGSYVIYELERDNYDYAFVSGPDNSYLWLLARKPQLPQNVVDRFISQAKALGFNTDALIMVNQN